MKSSSGEHFIGLDHVRTLAVFLVFTWHFIHASNGYPVSFDFVPALFPFSILNEGHTGVSLFMTLSGYLFAKLLDGKAIDYRAFLRNRALRLLPLLALVILIVGVQKCLEGESSGGYLGDVAKGRLLPTLPNGGWSITVEFHYYRILPVFLALLRRSRWLPLAIVGAAAAVRLLMQVQTGEVQSVAYWTIHGRVDQFALGMLVFQFRRYFSRRHLLAAAVMIGFSLFYWQFDRLGGFRPAYNSPSVIWIVLPTVEGLAYAVLIAWYDNSFAVLTRSGLPGCRTSGRVLLFDLPAALFLRQSRRRLHPQARHGSFRLPPRLPVGRAVFPVHDPARLSQLQVRRGALPQAEAALRERGHGGAGGAAPLIGVIGVARQNR